MLEVQQRFDFDADAAEVVAFIMRGQRDTREIWRTVGELAYWVMLCPVVGVSALYSVSFFRLQVCQARDVFYPVEGGRWWAKEGAHCIIDAEELAEIVFTQSRAGECQATLYLEGEHAKWAKYSSVGPSVGPLFIAKVWEEIITDWLASVTPNTEPPDKREATPAAEPPAVPGDSDAALAEREARRMARAAEMLHFPHGRRFGIHKVDTDSGSQMGDAPAAEPPAKSGDSDAEPQSDKERRVLEIYNQFISEGIDPTDEDIASRMPVNQRGNRPTREDMNRTRQAMRKRKITV